MCTLSSIRLLVMVMCWFKLVITIYVFGVGCYFAGSVDLQEAFGVQFKSYGLSLIFLALLSGGIILPHKYGVNRHNRFVLLCTFVFDTIVFAELVNFGLIVQSYTVPEFSKGLQLDCLKNTPTIYTLEECAQFYDSSRTAGFRLFWEGYFSKKENKIQFQVLSTLEGGLCCGFFQPFNCIANDDKFPSNRYTTGITKSLLKAKVQCGPYPNFYPQQSNCADYYDFANGIIGGCRYDLGVGFCLNVEITENSLGCASAVEDYAVALIAPHAVMLVASSMFNVIFMLFACCMWWKRKETDIFPEFITEHKTSVQYHNVKDQYVVVPKKDLLRHEGYLPPLKIYDEEEEDEEEEEGDDGEGGNDGDSLMEEGRAAAAAAGAAIVEGKDGGESSGAATMPFLDSKSMPMPSSTNATGGAISSEANIELTAKQSHS